MTEEKKNSANKAIADGYSLGINLVVSVFVGMGMGYGIDTLTGTKPLFLLIFMVLGFVAGIRMIMKSSEAE